MGAAPAILGTTRAPAPSASARGAGAGIARDHRQHGDARLHRAEAAVAREIRPAVFRAVQVLLPKDYLIWRLSGEFVSEMSDASGTLARLRTPRLVRPDARRDRADARADAAPRRRQRARRAAARHAAARMGIAGVTIAGGAGDNAASAIGMGVTGAGSGFLSLGTSGVLFAGNDRFAPNPDAAVHAFCHCVEGRWHQMSVILSAAASLDWLARAARPPACSPRAPNVQSRRVRRCSCRISVANVRRTTTHMHAACSSAVQRARRGRARLCGDGRRRVRDGRRLRRVRAAGTTLDAVSFIGGGSKSAFWARLCANATHRDATPRGRRGRCARGARRDR